MQKIDMMSAEYGKGIPQSVISVPERTERKFCIEPLREADMDFIIRMCDDIFKEHDTMASDPLKMAFFTNIEISIKALCNGDIIGCYLLNEDPIPQLEGYKLYEDLSTYLKRRSLHGVVLALKPEYRGFGFGRQLVEMTLAMGAYDYVWGYHVKSLNNLNHWIRNGRRLISENDTCYVTLKDL